MPSYEQPVFVRFEDADPAGVIFYPRAIAMAHSVVENLLRHSAWGWDAWFASPVHAAPLRHAEADFLRPMKAGENFAARAWVEKTGTTSVVFLVEFVADDGSVAARVRTVHVMIERENGKPVEMPPELRRALGEFTA